MDWILSGNVKKKHRVWDSWFDIFDVTVWQSQTRHSWFQEWYWKICVLSYFGANARKARELIISLHRKLMFSFFLLKSTMKHTVRNASITERFRIKSWAPLSVYLSIFCLKFLSLCFQRWQLLHYELMWSQMRRLLLTLKYWNEDSHIKCCPALNLV